MGYEINGAGKSINQLINFFKKRGPKQTYYDICHGMRNMINLILGTPRNKGRK